MVPNGQAVGRTHHRLPSGGFYGEYIESRIFSRQQVIGLRVRPQSNQRHSQRNMVSGAICIDFAIAWMESAGETTIQVHDRVVLSMGWCVLSAPPAGLLYWPLPALNGFCRIKDAFGIAKITRPMRCRCLFQRHISANRSMLQKHWVICNASKAGMPFARQQHAVVLQPKNGVW